MTILKPLPALPVTINDLFANLEVKTHDAKTVTVEIESKNKDHGVTAVSANGKIVVSGGQESDNGITINLERKTKKKGKTTIHVKNISGSNIDIAGGHGISNISITGEGITTKVIITVPKGTPIEVLRVDGEVKIGDTEGELLIGRKSGNTKIGKVASLTIGLGMSATAEVEGVLGNVYTNLKMSSKLRIKSGEAGTVKVWQANSSSFIFDGQADNTTVESGMSAATYIDNIVGSLTADIGPSSTFEVSQGRVDRLQTKQGMSSKLLFGGTATDANVELEMSASITITKVINNPVVKRGMSTSVKIGR